MIADYQFRAARGAFPGTVHGIVLPRFEREETEASLLLRRVSDIRVVYVCKELFCVFPEVINVLAEVVCDLRREHVHKQVREARIRKMGLDGAPRLMPEQVGQQRRAQRAWK